MKDKLYFIGLLLIFALIIGTGVYYGIKTFITFSVFDDSNNELVNATNDTGRITGNIQGVGAFVDDFDKRIKRVRSEIDRAAQSTERAESRVTNIERNLEGIEQGAGTVRAGIKIGEGAKERLGKLICQLQRENQEGSSQDRE